MQLKNKVEREVFLENYREWEAWKEIPELEVKLYRFTLPNGSMIIATEYPAMRLNGYNAGNYDFEKSTDVKYHLILSDTDSYRVPYDIGRHKLYDPSGDSKSLIIKYLTDTKPEV